jgi:hypothetical protein
MTVTHPPCCPVDNRRLFGGEGVKWSSEETLIPSGAGVHKAWLYVSIPAIQRYGAVSGDCVTCGDRSMRVDENIMQQSS